MVKAVAAESTPLPSVETEAVRPQFFRLRRPAFGFGLEAKRGVDTQSTICHGLLLAACFENTMHVERNLGTQPITTLLERLQLTAADLVQASEEQLTFKMVARALKGRRLTGRAQGKILRAVNRAAQQKFNRSDLFNY